MKYQLVAAAGAAIAPFAAAAGHRHHNNPHRAVETKVHWHYETVTQYVTADATPTTFQRKQRPTRRPISSVQSSSAAAAPAPVSSSSSSAAAVVVPSSSAVAISSSSVAVAPSSSAAPVVPSSSAAPVVSSSSAAVVPSSSAVVVPSSSAAPSSSSVAAASPSSSAAVSSVNNVASSTSSAAAAGSTGITKQNLTPNGRKAGLSGYIGIQDMQAFSDLSPYISWYSDYTANTPNIDNVKGVGMLWAGDGSACTTLANERITTFNKMEAEPTQPEIMFGFYEPDCYCDMSSEMSVAAGTQQWNEKIAPMAAQGTVLGSPSMCKQNDEDWLQPFIDGGLDAHWDVTSLHINVPTLDALKKDVEYYLATYGKPLWISEFACVHNVGGFNPCTDQAEIDQFIYDAVSFFEGNESVVAYGPSNGAGLGTAWPLTDADGNLSHTGMTYLNAIKGL